MWNPFFVVVGREAFFAHCRFLCHVGGRGFATTDTRPHEVFGRCQDPKSLLSREPRADLPHRDCDLGGSGEFTRFHFMILAEVRPVPRRPSLCRRPVIRPFWDAGCPSFQIFGQIFTTFQCAWATLSYNADPFFAPLVEGKPILPGFIFSRRCTAVKNRRDVRP